MGSINALGDGKKYEERAIEIGWERNKLYIHLAARNNPGTFHWSLYLTEEIPEKGWVYHVFDPVPDRWVLEMFGGDGEEVRELVKGSGDGGWGGDCSEDSESPGEEPRGDGEQEIVGSEGESKEGRGDQTETKKKYEDKRKRESGDTGHSSDELSDEDEQLESDGSTKEKKEDRKHKRNKTDDGEHQEKNEGLHNPEDGGNSKNHDPKDNNNHNHTFLTSSSLLAAIEIGTDIQDMRPIIEETISTEWEMGRKKIAKGEKICREFLLKCVEELESVGVLSFRDGKGVGDVEREAEEFGLLSDPALNVGARRGRVWKSRVVE
ncbi:hypothetical protein EAE96_003413 [Botrytis aclada]|nr:hypothetical protein EAE96_003413 [Botrytis aclada]